jgi:CheY-like chemotaxis protein
MESEEGSIVWRSETSETRAKGATGIRVLVADDDGCVRSLFADLLRQIEGVSSVLEVEDGADAVRVVREAGVHVAVLDLTMPRVDGLEAALKLVALQPSMRIALHSSEPRTLAERASGVGLPLFDKLDVRSLVAWVEQQASSFSAADGRAGARVRPLARKLDLRCSLCGYGIVSLAPPARCPMCQAVAVWTERSARLTRNAAAGEWFAA